MAIWNSNQLLDVCKAEPTQTNTCIAQAIINMYMSAKNFFQDDMVNCMMEFLASGSLNFRKYNIQF